MTRDVGAVRGPIARIEPAGPPGDLDRGAALLVVLLIAALLAGLGSGLVVLTTTEMQIAANHRTAGETLYAAEAIVDRAVRDLRAAPQWTAVLNGTTPSTFCDATRRPTLRSRETVDLDAITVELQAESDAAWGANNPVWRLYAWGALASMGGGLDRASSYVAAWVSDDPSERDGNPLQDTNNRIRLHAEAYVSSQTRRVVEATVVREATGVRVLTWREVR